MFGVKPDGRFGYHGAVMRVLHHLPFSADCRLVRLLLAELRVPAELVEERVWDRPPGLFRLNPAGEVPVLVEPEDGPVVVDAWPIVEHLCDTVPGGGLIGADPPARAETRRLLSWFGRKLAREVTENLAGEKILKRLMRRGQPCSEAIRAGHANIHYHLDYVDFLAEQRRWLAGDRLSVADLAAAAQLSVIDYLGDVPWLEHAEAKDWYARLKSRPSFRPLLEDRLPGMAPAAHYDDLDF